MRQMAGKDEETSLEDSSFGPGHFKLYTDFGSTCFFFHGATF